MNSRLAKIAGLFGAVTLALLVVALVLTPEPARSTVHSADRAEPARPGGNALAVSADPARRVAPDEDPGPEPVAVTAPATLRELLREIAAAEEAIVNEPRQGGAEPPAALIERLEAAVGPIIEERAMLASVLELLAPGANGEPQLDDREMYGAVRAVYWSMVVLTGRGDGRDPVLAILAALPHVHADAREVLMMNVMRAAADGELVLDASYLNDVLELRALFPDDEGLFSELLAVIGESLSISERDALFAVFEAETDDPVLAGLTIKNLLLGSDPDFGLLLAELRFDGDDIAGDVKYAIANAVVDNADVFSATSFLAERADELRNRLALWTKVGFRTGGVEALEARYERLAANDADPRAREMLVAGMVNLPGERLIAIAQRETEPGVIGQALLTASARRDPGTAESYATTLDLLRENFGAGGTRELGASYVVSVASNTARRAERSGHEAALREAVEILDETARDQTVSIEARRAAIERLRPFVSGAEIEALEAIL